MTNRKHSKIIGLYPTMLMIIFNVSVKQKQEMIKLGKIYKTQLYAYDKTCILKKCRELEHKKWKKIYYA